MYSLGRQGSAPPTYWRPPHALSATRLVTTGPRSASSLRPCSHGGRRTRCARLFFIQRIGAISIHTYSIYSTTTRACQPRPTARSPAGLPGCGFVAAPAILGDGAPAATAPARPGDPASPASPRPGSGSAPARMRRLRARGGEGRGENGAREAIRRRARPIAARASREVEAPRRHWTASSYSSKGTLGVGSMRDLRARDGFLRLQLRVLHSPLHGRCCRGGGVW